MHVGTQIRPRDDDDYRVWAQLGVKHVCVDPPGDPHHWSLDDLCRHKEHVSSFGLSLDTVQLPLSSRPIEEAESPNILLGKDPERQREIDSICGLIERLAAAGIPAAKYNLCIIGIPRTAREPGRGGSRNAALKAPLDEFWRAIKLDLYGTFLGCPFGIPELIKAGGGSVINMSSNVALMGVAGRDCYTAAKGGIAAITRSLAVAYAPQRVRVNAIAPSATMTERVKKLVEGTAALTRLADSHLLGLIEPDDIAGMALYLASDESRMVTGHVLPVDSGVTIS